MKTPRQIAGGEKREERKREAVVTASEKLSEKRQQTDLLTPNLTSPGAAPPETELRQDNPWDTDNTLNPG